MIYIREFTSFFRRLYGTEPHAKTGRWTLVVEGRIKDRTKAGMIFREVGTYEQILEQAIEDFKLEHGRFPEKSKIRGFEPINQEEGP